MTPAMEDSDGEVELSDEKSMGGDAPTETKSDGASDEELDRTCFRRACSFVHNTLINSPKSLKLT